MQTRNSDHDKSVKETDYEDELSRDDQQAATHTVSTAYSPDTSRRLRKGGIVVACVLIAALLLVRLVGFFHEHALAGEARTAASAPRTVDVITAAPVGAAQHFALPGQTAAWHSSTIYARVNGYVAKWFVDIGDHVHTGEIMATIDTPELDAQLSAARAELKAAEAQVQVRKAEAAFSKTTYERWHDSPNGVVSAQETDEKQAAFATATAQLQQADAQVALDQARVDQYSALSDYKQVRAPFDGTITQRNIDIGNLVTAGSTSATTSLYVMTQNDPMRVMVEVPQSAATDLMQGELPVTVSGTGGGQALIYSGKVTRTAQALNAQARTLQVEVDIPNASGKWVPGMYVTASFDLPPRGLVQVPAAALLFRATGTQVASVDNQGRVTMRDVTIARDDGNQVELGSGVKPGERLILNLSSEINGGDVVEVARQP
ncbi:MAG TPA: efflux RND transporter periplasmic adaptor subunit [Steroidobacteraceae bacterium]|jgi:RND family efflux transporter MFP subunit|nr:efflux RND transporter periplasmic adaptor subunit [Steroidobacteraceae bacterium]